MTCYIETGFTFEVKDWTRSEVELVVADYFDMLVKELAGIPYSKTKHRQRLMPLLNQRSAGSIEFKHQNISAVLANHDKLYVRGYLPRFNYQGLLEEVVIDHYVRDHISIEEMFQKFVDKDIVQPVVDDFSSLMVDPPSTTMIRESEPVYTKGGVTINYLDREQKNQKLGALGEELVLQYEKWYLTLTGKEHLADKVIWISKEEGDGAGFDILSREANGSDKYIEVKTTRLGKQTPFFFTKNELQFSQKYRDSYHLFRLFNFDSNARMFTKYGSLDSICTSFPTTFKGYP